jgi:hypothetical protein
MFIVKILEELRHDFTLLFFILKNDGRIAQIFLKFTFGYLLNIWIDATCAVDNA